MMILKKLSGKLASELRAAPAMDLLRRFTRIGSGSPGLSSTLLLLVMIVTPRGCACSFSTALADISSGIGAACGTFHPADNSKPLICSANQDASPSPFLYKISAVKDVCFNDAISACNDSLLSNFSVRGNRCCWSLSTSAWALAVSPFCFSRSIVNCSKCVFKYDSLTLPIQTNRTVEMTPATKLTINPIFAQSDNREAQSSDGHMRMSPWFPLSAIAVVLFSGVFCLIML